MELLSFSGCFGGPYGGIPSLAPRLPFGRLSPRLDGLDARACPLHWGRGRERFCRTLSLHPLARILRTAGDGLHGRLARAPRAGSAPGRGWTGLASGLLRLAIHSAEP